MQQYSLRFIKYAIIFFFQLVYSDGFAQQTAGMRVLDKLKVHNATAIQEKLFVHTDKEFYVAGDIVWFKIYYTDAISRKPMQMSKVAYAEILNSTNEPVLQVKIALQPGTGKGSFYLPASLPTGHYSIRAYTNWMKNFDVDYFFEKKITIVNTLKNPEPTTLMDSAAVVLNFFPEGGNLVNGLRSKVGFMATGSKGSINEFKGLILDKNNDTILSFAPMKSGIGHFEFTPQAGNTYQALVVLPGGVILNRTLPAIYEYGYVMNVKEEQQQVRVMVKVKKRPGEQAVEQLLLAVHSRGIINTVEKGFVSVADSMVFLIDKKKIGSGVTYFTLFDGNERPICERLFFMKPGHAITLNIQSDKAAYTNRQRIDLSVTTEPAATSSTATTLNLSASVFYMDSLQNEDPSTITEYMWLESELPGSIESPGYYLSGDPGATEAADNLMLTHGWRRFRWNDVLAKDDSFIKYLPEINGHLVMGRIKDPVSDKPVEKIDAYLSIPGNPFGFYTSSSNKNGLVLFEVKNYYGNGQVIAQPGLKKDSLYKVDILQPYAETIAAQKYAPYKLSAEIKNRLLEKSISMQVQNIFTGDSLRNYSEPHFTDTLPFFGQPEVTYRLDDYQRFTTMEEVLREYVREVGVGLKNEKLIFKIFDPLAHDFYDGNSLVLLDGVPLTDADRIFSFDPLKVKKLDVIRNRYVLGRSSFNGVASFTTYEGGFSAFELDPKLIAIDYNGLQLQREFYSPVYETREQLEKRIPDFRNTLFWSPDVATGNDGRASLQFYSSDLHGKYRVLVQGMNENGDFVSGTTVIEVK